MSSVSHCGLAATNYDNEFITTSQQQDMSLKSGEKTRTHHNTNQNDCGDICDFSLHTAKTTEHRFAFATDTVRFETPFQKNKSRSHGTNDDKKCFRKQAHRYHGDGPTHCKLRSTPLSRAQKRLIVAIDICALAGQNHETRREKWSTPSQETYC